MSNPIYTSHQGLVSLANRECGYRNVWVDRGDTARWSNRGNLVVEHNRRGTEDVCSDGRVLSRNQPNNNRPDYYPRHDRYQPRHEHYDRGIDPGVGLLFGAALGIAVGAALADD